MRVQVTSIFGITNLVTIAVGGINLVGKNLHLVLHNTTRGILTVVEQIKKVEKKCAQTAAFQGRQGYILCILVSKLGILPKYSVTQYGIFRRKRGKCLLSFIFRYL